MALTDTEIKKLKPGAKPYQRSDGDGLYLWVTVKGGKSWRWNYRFDNKEKTITYGLYPDVPLALARERHYEARKSRAAGIDPMAIRGEEKLAKKVGLENSFESIARKWLAHWRANKSPRHVDGTVRRLEADIFPAIGARPIAHIEVMDLVRVARKIESRGASEAAARALGVCGQIFRFAAANGYAQRNPANEIRPSDVLRPVKKVNYARIDEKELPELLTKIEVYQGTHITRLAMKLMVLTFVRTGELIGAKWSEFDLDNARWNIGAERMKMRTPHIVPLSTQALEVIKLLQVLSGNSEWLFPGAYRSKKPMSNNTILKALERMGYKGRMTGHGFRGLASTILHEQGVNHDHIELQLAHSPRNEVSAAYNHALYLEPRAKMMQEWANYLEQIQRLKS